MHCVNYMYQSFKVTITNGGQQMRCMSIYMHHFSKEMQCKLIKGQL